MILRIPFLICAVISLSLAKMTMKKFASEFEDKCFQNEETDPFRINGQDTPLSNSLENFIAMAEKFEVVNPSFDLKEELAYFLSEYVFENIKFVNGRLDVWKLGRAKLETIERMWDPDTTGYKPTPTVPFSDDEKCSLYYMISHSMLQKDEQLLKSYSPGNFSFQPNRGAAAEDIDPDHYYPQELGVVAIRGTDASVSLSKVLMGLYVGLKEDRKTELTSYEDVEDTPDEVLPTDKTVDALYSVTLAEVLLQSKWIGSDRPGFAPNGKWVSIPLGRDKSISGFCPMVYKHQVPNGPLPAYSYSSVRGATDGLILGSAIHDIYVKKKNSKLSQILRMYYNPDGISLENPLEGTNEKRISFCRRYDLISALESRLHDQMLSYGYLIADSYKDVKGAIDNAESLYSREKGTIFGMSNSEIQDYCSRSYNMEKPEDLPRETFLDVIAVMDSSNSENSFQEQQLIIGHLAKQLDLRYTGSRMTILLDQKIDWNEMQQTRTVSGSSNTITLKPIVDNTYSSSCAACTVGQIAYESSSMERDQVITAINQLLQERKDNETKYSGVNGKVVIYFNYGSDDGRNGNNRIQGRLEKALRDLHLNHLDVLFFAVGLDSEILKKYAKNDPSLVFLGTDGTADTVAKQIYKRISFAPALLQYADCDLVRNEKGATYDNFVSPHTIQHYEMPAQYFLKSKHITVNFESQNGYIRVCYNRATMRPENEAKNCKNTTVGSAGIEFKMSNPCKSFTEATCSPFYFSIMGMDTSLDMRQDNRQRDFCNDLQEHWCSNLDQVKYKVYHSGIRCSGCLGISATPAAIFLSILLMFIIQKRL